MVDCHSEAFVLIKIAEEDLHPGTSGNLYQRIAGPLGSVPVTQIGNTVVETIFVGYYEEISRRLATNALTEGLWIRNEDHVSGGCGARHGCIRLGRVFDKAYSPTKTTIMTTKVRTGVPIADL